MSDIFDTLLLLALPASGKSEVRTYLTARSPKEFHMGPTVQLDDYPYVHLQILVDEALAKLGHEQVYHHPDSGSQGNGPFKDTRELGGLIHLLNEDYAELQRGEAERPDNPAGRLLERFDAASEQVGASVKLREMSADLRGQIEKAIEADARKHFEEKAAGCPASLDGKTVVIEFARGGPAGGDLPFPPSFGYAGALPHLSEEILKRASILYIWVTPEESRRKNRARARPDGQGSILFHGTPESVMRAEYGRCDMHHLIETSDVSDTVRVEAVSGGAFHVPTAVFDNRVDLTTFLRKDEPEWTDEEVQSIHGSIKEASDRLWAASVRRSS